MHEACTLVAVLHSVVRAEYDAMVNKSCVICETHSKIGQNIETAVAIIVQD